LRVSIPDAARLVEAVLERSTGKDSSIHGESHWQRVAAAGLTLLPETPGADPTLVFLFALFHDSMRLNDNYDPLHGPRERLWPGSYAARPSTWRTPRWAC
jgi:uncharacterized protein